LGNATGSAPQWVKVLEFCKTHGGKINAAISYVIGAAGYVADVWGTWIPLPEDLRTRGRTWALLLSVLTVATAVYHVSTMAEAAGGSDSAVPGLRRWNRPLKLLWWAVGCFAGFGIIFPTLFDFAEARWKQPDTDFDLYYWRLEPIIYGCAFACLSSAAVYLLAFIGFLANFLLSRFLPSQTGSGPPG
jgi:hypothetical protein